jgi:hypothetical protein
VEFRLAAFAARHRPFRRHSTRKRAVWQRGRTTTGFDQARALRDLASLVECRLVEGHCRGLPRVGTLSD